MLLCSHTVGFIVLIFKQQIHVFKMSYFHVNSNPKAMKQHILTPPMVCSSMPAAANAGGSTEPVCLCLLGEQASRQAAEWGTPLERTAMPH